MNRMQTIANSSRVKKFAFEKPAGDFELGVDFLGTKKLRDPKYKVWSKLIWFLISTVCLVICCYQIALCVLQYYAAPVSVSVEIKQVTNFTFPTITLCGRDLAKNINSYIQIWIQYKNCEHNLSTCSPALIEDINNLRRMKNSLLSEFWYDMDIKGIQVTKPCSAFLRDKRNCGQKPANHYMKITGMNTTWGHCLSLTPIDTEMIFKGPRTWLSITWYFQPLDKNKVEDNDYLNDDITRLYYYVHSAGLSLTHEAPYATESIYVNHKTTVRVTASEYKFLNKKNDPCLPEDQVVNCQKECFDKKLESTLPCSLPFVNPTLLQPCESFYDVISAFNVSDHLYNEFNRDECNCPRKCHEIRYKVTSDGQRRLSSNTTTIITFRYSEDTHEILIEKPAYTAANLFSDIGGTLGLYLGICIFTVLEIFEAIILHCLRAVRAR